MKSFIPWIGGKSLLASRIVGLFPTNFARYIEVFGGGGSVLFAKAKHADFEVYNDSNGDLVNLFRCVKHHPEELQRELSCVLNSREIFLDYRALAACRGLTDIQRAAMFYVNLRISYGADGRSYGCNPRIVSADRFVEIQQRLSRVVIENKDFDDLIKVYDRPNALLYCDPPYHGTERHYTNTFSDGDHLRLKRCLNGIKGRFLLSYNDDDFIRDLYSDYTIISIERPNNLSTGTFKELIIKNY